MSRKCLIIQQRVLVLLLLVAAFLIPANSETVVIAPGNVSLGNRIPQEEWNRTFGGSADDVGTFVQQTVDGGYIITGYTSSYGVDAPYSWIIKAPYRGDVWLIKTNSTGYKNWDRTFGGLGKDLGFAVQQTNDGGYIIAGAKKAFWILLSYDVWLIKTDPEGNKVWDRTFGGSDEDVAFSIRQTNDSSSIIAGYTLSYGNRKAWLIKMNQDGNKVWERAFGGKDTEAASVQLTKDGGYIITGYMKSSGDGNEDLWLLKTNSIGAVDWSKTFGGPNRDIGLSVQETRDGGYIVTGLTESFGTGKGDVWLIKTSSTGNKEWDRTFGGPYYAMGTSVQETKDDGFIITGQNTTSSNIDRNYPWLLNLANSGCVWLIKTDSEGNKQWDKTFGGLRSDWGNCVQETQDGGYIITGVTESYGAGKEDVWLIKVK